MWGACDLGQHEVWIHQIFLGAPFSILYCSMGVTNPCVTDQMMHHYCDVIRLIHITVLITTPITVPPLSRLRPVLSPF